MKARSSEGEQVQNISEETRTKQKKLLKKALEHTHTHTELHEMKAAPSFHFRSVL